MRRAHFIDIGIILDLKLKPWLVSKKDPNIPLLKIEPYDFNLFKSGIYKSHNNKIIFNGEVFWLSTDFMNKVKVYTKNNNIDISSLAISMQEYLNSDIIKDIEYDLNMDIFKKVINTKDDIYIFCSKNTKSNYSTQILSLNERLSKIGLSIKNYYSLSETFMNTNSDDISYLKVKILIQHLIGLKTLDGIFIDHVIDRYDEILYYDDSISSIELSKKINFVLENLLIKTDNFIKLKVKDIIKQNNILLYVNEFTYNKVNRFKETMIKIEFTNLIKSFENFNFSFLK